MKINELHATAHHEAGHAVVSFYLFVRFKHVTVVPKGASLGHVKPVRPPKWARDPDSDTPLKQREYWEHDTIINFAGRIAEEKYRGRRVRNSHRDDYQHIADSALRFGGASPEVHIHWCNWLHAKANEMVERHWPEIERLATALVRHGTLNWEDATEVIWPGSNALRASLTAKQR